MAGGGYEGYCGTLTPHEQRERVWSAHSAGYMRSAAGSPDFGDTDAGGEALLMDHLGETGPATADNHAWRVTLRTAYEGGVIAGKQVRG